MTDRRIYRDKGREEALDTGGIDYDRLVAELMPAKEHLPIGHLHSNGEFCMERNPVSPPWWPIDLYDRCALEDAREAGRREMRDECADVASAWSRSRGGSDQVTQKLADAIRSIPVRKP